MLDITSTRMLGQYGFLAKVTNLTRIDDNIFTFPPSELTHSLSLQVFSTFEKLGISVDVVATSEVSISLTLDPSKFCSRELIQHVSL